MKRNPSIELLRCLLMFGIVLQHCAGKGVVRLPWLGLSLNFCVVGFVFISGYFCIKFSWRKLLSLYGVAIACALIGALVQFIVVGDVHIFFERMYLLALVLVFTRLCCIDEGLANITCEGQGMDDFVYPEARHPWLCKQRNPEDLAEKIFCYYKNRPTQRLAMETDIDVSIPKFLDEVEELR